MNAPVSLTVDLSMIDSISFTDVPVVIGDSKFGAAFLKLAIMSPKNFSTSGVA